MKPDKYTLDLDKDIRVTKKKKPVQEMTTIDGETLSIKPAIGYRLKDLSGEYVTIGEIQLPSVAVLPVKSGNPYRQRGGKFGKKTV